MIANLNQASATIRAVVLLGAATTLGQISWSCVSQHCNEQGDFGCDLTPPISLLQRNVTKVYSLAQEYSKEPYSLLQENQSLSKTEDVWDEDEEFTSVHDGLTIEGALETLDIPVRANALWPPMMGVAAPLLQDSQVESSVPAAQQFISNTSLEADRLALPTTSASPVFQLRKEVTAPLQKVALTQTAEGMWQLLEASNLVDPPKSSLQALPLERLDRKTLEGSQKAFALSLPHGIHATFCMIGLVAVMIFAACPRLSTEVSEKLQDKYKLFYNNETSQWVDTEVVGELHDGQLLLRRLRDGHLFSVHPTDENLRSMDRSADDATPTVQFPQFHPYHPRHFTVPSIIAAIHHRVKEAHEKIVVVASRGRRKHQGDESSTPSQTASHTPFELADEMHHFLTEVGEDIGMDYLDFEDATGDAIHEVEEEGALLVESASKRFHHLKSKLGHSKRFRKVIGLMEKLEKWEGKSKRYGMRKHAKAVEKIQHVESRLQKIMWKHSK